MTCATCGSANTSAGGICAVCDPWAVNAPQGQGKVRAAGLTDAGQQLPRWIEKTLAKRIPPEAVEEARNRPFVLKYYILAIYCGLGALFILLSALVDSADFPSLAGFRFLALTPIVLLLVRLNFGPRRRQVSWLAATLHYIRDNRPELGFRWIARMRELRLARTISFIILPVWVVLIELNVVLHPHSLDQVRLLFAIDGAGFILVAVVSWYQAAVLLRRAFTKIAGRVAR